MNRLRADGLLVFAALIWGTAFVAQKQANEVMGPILFVGIRFLLTAAAIAPLAWVEARRAPVAVPRSDWALIGAIGLGLGIGAVLQQVGLTTTTATKGGFLTAVYLVLVPFVGRVTAGTPLRLPILLACAVSVAGAFLLAGQIDLRSWNRGDLTLLAADVAWAFQITLVSRFLARSDRPFLLAFGQSALAGTGALLLGLALEPLELGGIERAGASILYAGLVSGGVAFTIQVLAQKHTPAAEASLLMALESVFAAASGAIALHERLAPPAVLGCVLILAGAVAVELGPALMGRGGVKVSPAP